jgi:hypothetical protein
MKKKFNLKPQNRKEYDFSRDQNKKESDKCNNIFFDGSYNDYGTVIALLGLMGLSVIIVGIAAVGLVIWGLVALFS